MTSNIKITKDEIRSYKELDLISKIRVVQDKLETFSSKYGLEFDEFKKQMDESDEDFEKFDDYIEWKAYRQELIDLETALDEVRDATTFEITG